MSIFKRILFAGDFSEPSREAFRAACSLAREPGSQLHVLNVVEPVLLEGPKGPSHGASFPAILPAVTPAHRKEVDGRLRGFYHADAPVAVDYHVRVGAAPDQILSAADELDSDLIVVGTGGRSGIDRLVWGSVAVSVLRRSSRPLLIIRSPEGSAQDTPIRLILHPTDFSAGSWPALGVARALARANGAGLVLLHVAPDDLLAAGSHHAPADLGPERETLARLQEETARAGLDGSVLTRLTQGDAVAEILLAVDELGCDLIVMGSHGRGGIRRLLMGSVAEAVVRAATCPALVVRDVRDHRPNVGGEGHNVAKAGAIA